MEVDMSIDKIGGAKNHENMSTTCGVLANHSVWNCISDTENNAVVVDHSLTNVSCMMPG